MWTATFQGWSVDNRRGSHMSHAKAEDHLAEVPLFSRLTAKEREQVRSLMTDLDVPAGTVLARQGATGHEFFVILSGTASVDRDGEHLADVGPGDFQGELSLLDGGPRTATVTTTSPMRLMVMSQVEFTTLLETAPMIARQMLPALAHRVRSLAADLHSH